MQVSLTVMLQRIRKESVRSTLASLETVSWLMRILQRDVISTSMDGTPDLPMSGSHIISTLDRRRTYYLTVPYILKIAYCVVLMRMFLLCFPVRLLLIC